MTYQSRPLGVEHQLDGFSSGRPALDDWLKRHALRAQQQDTARSYVWTRQGESGVIAYYSIAPTEVRHNGLSRAMSGGISVIPTYLLARLALDTSLQGHGLGEQLLLDALEVIVRASAATSGRLILVDAIDDVAHSFYRRFGFQPIAGSMRLAMKTSTARAALSL